SATLAVNAINTFGPILYNLYGSSEFGLISLATPDDLKQHSDTVGRVLPGMHLRIQPLQRDTQLGNISVYRRGRYETTGDLGSFDKDQNLFLFGRSDEAIVCGGHIVYLQELEAQLHRLLPFVLECATIGVPDEEFGQRVQLFVVLNADAKTTPIRQIQETLHLHLPKRLWPIRITVLAGLPRTPSGKLVRHQLQTYSISKSNSAKSTSLSLL
ncbi:MAG: AMP-binding enzyme, partial [Trueperaceae bacterium]